MELNSCENGSLNMEVNGDEEILMKTKSSLYLKSTEVDCSMSSEENTDDHVTGDVKRKFSMLFWTVDLGGHWHRLASKCAADLREPATAGHVTLAFCYPIRCK